MYTHVAHVYGSGQTRLFLAATLYSRDSFSSPSATRTSAQYMSIFQWLTFFVLEHIVMFLVNDHTPVTWLFPAKNTNGRNNNNNHHNINDRSSYCIIVRRPFCGQNNTKYIMHRMFLFFCTNFENILILVNAIEKYYFVFSEFRSFKGTFTYSYL